MKKKLLIFVVTYKASFRIFNLIKKIPFKKLSKFDYQIYISDDNSDDNISLKYIKLTKYKFGSKVKLNFNKNNIGYGANIKKCIKYALKNKYDYAAMLHGDNQYDPKYLSNMINLMTGKDKYDAIVGSRLMNKKSALKGNMPLYKYLGNIFLSTYFNFFFNTKFTDCHTWYWIYRCSKIKSLNLKWENKFWFDLDLRLQIVEKKKKIKEIAIRTFYGSERSSIHFIYAIRFFYKVIKFKLFKKI